MTLRDATRAPRARQDASHRFLAASVRAMLAQTFPTTFGARAGLAGSIQLAVGCRGAGRWSVAELV